MIKDFAHEVPLPIHSLGPALNREEAESDESLEVCLYSEVVMDTAVEEKLTEEVDEPLMVNPTAEMVDSFTEANSLTNLIPEVVVVVESPTLAVERAIESATVGRRRRHPTRKQRLSRYLRKKLFCCLKPRVVDE